MAGLTICLECKTPVKAGADRTLECGHPVPMLRPSLDEIARHPELRERFQLVLAGFIL